jgi:conjugative transfer pilus assembly protein TraH
MGFKKSLSRFMILIFITSACHAGIGEDMMRFFKEAGMASNVTTPAYYKDQTAGYYSGGSLVTRNAVKNAQPATIQMPGFKAGCGGIDLWTGGFSHISASQLIEMMRNIGSSAASYAFMLAVQTVSPQIYNIINELNALATKINQTNINSCEAAATMLGGLWPKSDQASKHLCQAMGSNLGSFSDWAAARQGCGAKGDRENVFRSKGSDPRYKDMFVGEFNLAWKAIQSNAFLSSDRDLAQLFLTLVGSIIARKYGDGYEVITLPGHADRDDVLNGLLNGGDTPIYGCDSDQCLNPKLAKFTLSDAHAFLKKVHKVLESLIQKIYEDEEPTIEEKDFLNSTRLPVYKILNVTTAYRKGTAPVDVHQYADLIALDILYKYILEVIDIVHDSVAQLKVVQVDDSHLERFLNYLRLARERITVRRNSAFQHMDSVLSFIQSTQLIEKQLHVMLGNVGNESNWM